MLCIRPRLDVKTIPHPLEERLILYCVVESGIMRNVNKGANLKEDVFCCV